MPFEIRSYVAADAGDLVALALRAWEPVFDSLQAVLGVALFVSPRGEDWRKSQAADVRSTIEAEGARTWVAEIDGTGRGFATAARSPAAETGEIVMVAVDPSYQRRGMATTPRQRPPGLATRARSR